MINPKTMFKMYWKTLFLTPKTKKNFFTRGIPIVITITGRCNLHCDYCPMFKTVDGGRDDRYPLFNDCTVEDWKKFISEYPVWVEEFFISGGEPTLYPQIAELINWMVERGHHVCIYSNLKKPEAFLRLKKSYRLVLYPTLHASDNAERFAKAMDMLKDVVRIVPIELQEEHQRKDTKHKLTFSDGFFRDEMRLHFAPDTPRTKRTWMGSVPLYDSVKPKLTEGK